MPNGKFADPKIVIFARRNEIEIKRYYVTAIADFRNISGTLRVYFYDPSVSDSRWCRREEKLRRRFGEGKERGKLKSSPVKNSNGNRSIREHSLRMNTWWIHNQHNGHLITYLMVNKCLSVQVLDKQNKMATQHKMVDGLGFPRIVDGRARTQELQHCSRGTAARANLSRREGDRGPPHRPIARPTGPPPAQRGGELFGGNDSLITRDKQGFVENSRIINLERLISRD